MKAKYVVPKHIRFLLLGLYILVTSHAYSSAITQPINTAQCILINQVHLVNSQRLTKVEPRRINAWRQQIEGQCVDDRKLLEYADYITADLVRAGYLTSYLYYPEQTFLFGILRIKIVEGTISAVSYQNEKNKDRSLLSIFPLKPGDLLNLRHIEQGLSNLQNVSLLPFHINLVPDDADKNATQVIVVGQQRRALNGVISYKAHRAAGQTTNVISHIWMLANPLLRSDFLYSEVNHHLNAFNGSEMKSMVLLYSLPYHYWLFSVSAEYHKNQVVITNYDVNLPFQQRSWGLLLQIERILNRTENAVTSLGIGSQVQKSDTFLSDLRLQTQKRLASYAIAEFSHQVDFLKGNTLVSLKYKQGVDWFGANAQKTTGLDKAQIFQFSLSNLREIQPFYYLSQLDVQLSRSNLDALLERDTFIGNGGVSGFLTGVKHFEMGDHSLKFHNELRWQTPWPHVQLYSSLGLGTTANDRATFWKENLLLGCKIGAKGQLKGLSYHLFIDTPLWQSQPLAFNTVSSGIKFSFHY
ncbi:ShlB/FhaC/HecB family hemolysin secretion/activation protein [Providencia hangzhouensis]